MMKIPTTARNQTETHCPCVDMATSSCVDYQSFSRSPLPPSVVRVYDREWSLGLFNAPNSDSHEQLQIQTCLAIRRAVNLATSSVLQCMSTIVTTGAERGYIRCGQSDQWLVGIM